MRAPFWDVLGIDPTTSEVDIRRAYALKLRITNPEDDADGFKKLRQAYEHALGYVRYMQLRPPEDVEDDREIDEDGEDGVYFGEDLISAPAPSPVPGGAHISPEQAALDPLEVERRDHDALCPRLVAALQENRPPNECLEAFNAILKSPAMQQLAVFAATEGWVAHMLITSRPASDPLFEPAIAYFNWENERVGDRNNGSQHVLYLRDQVRSDGHAYRLLQRLKVKGHDYHKAWKETMLPPSQRSWLNKLLSLRRTKHVMEFLQYIRGWSPVLEDSLNRDAVKWWIKREPIGLRVTNVFAMLMALTVVAAIGFSIQYLNDHGGRTRGPEYIRMVRPAPAPAPRPNPDGSGPGFFELVPAEAAEPLKRYAARRDCKEAVYRLGKVPAGVMTLSTLQADDRCRRVLEMTPDSLLMRQYAGIVALRLGEADAALDHFETILKASPNDPYALFGRGLVSTLPTDGPALGKAKDMSDALAMNADVARYFGDFGLTAPDVKPSPRKPRSRLPNFDPVHADTNAKILENPDALDGQGLGDHFGVDNSTAGKVVLECAISVKGRAVNCHIVSEEPPNVGLGEVGLLAMKDIRYKPPSLDGEPVGGLPLDYTLRYNTKTEDDVLQSIK